MPLQLPYEVLPFQYRAQCTTFTEWITLFTLCLAPLIAHLVSGTVPVAYLARKRPRWHDTLCHYNPTSIIWRYAAITDRRLRSINWGPHDLAAANAIFWTAQGWNGHESMVITAAPYCVQEPEHTSVKPFSVTMLKTVIVTLQGVSASYALVGIFTGIPASSNPIAGQALDVVFVPLAMLGLLRLCTAVWLTDEFIYLYKDDILPQLSPSSIAESEDGFPLINSLDCPSLKIEALPRCPERYVSPDASWTSRIFRAFYLALCGCIWVMTFLSTIPIMPVSYIPKIASTTSFIQRVFYFVLLSVSLVLYSVYFIRGKTTTTIIPCISSTWYKIYTILVMVTMLIIVAIAGLETWKGHDGVYRSFPLDVSLECSARDNWWPVYSDSLFSGLVSTTREDTFRLGNDRISGLSGVSRSDTTYSDESVWLYNLTGWCTGRLEETSWTTL